MKLTELPLVLCNVFFVQFITKCLFILKQCLFNWKYTIVLLVLLSIKYYLCKVIFIKATEGKFHL